ncbi:MAG: hypothetical protein R3C59_12465 [Planctomycetaceae bacterium]
MKSCLLTIALTVSATTLLFADESTVPSPADSDSTNSVPSPAGATPVKSAVNAATGERWLFVCCGLPGDDEHRERLTAACRKLAENAADVLGVNGDHIRLLAGDVQMQQELNAIVPDVGVCTRKSVQAGLTELCEQVAQQDSCWVVLLGHAHLYGTRSQFNVLDADFDQNDFGNWAKPLKCREQVFLITLPVSGFWTKPLRMPSRVVITATEADLEYTGTEMPYALTDVLSGDSDHASLDDVDGDGVLSLLDLYLATNLEIHGRFTALERLQTEHASLDDNGDGRGSEVQLPYLPVKQEEPADADAEEAADAEVEDAKPPEVSLPEPVSNQNLDGFRSRQILLKRKAE